MLMYQCFLYFRFTMPYHDLLSLDTFDYVFFAIFSPLKTPLSLHDCMYFDMYILCIEIYVLFVPILIFFIFKGRL